MSVSSSSRARGWRALLSLVAVGTLVLYAHPGFASGVDVAVVDTTIPTTSVSLAPGASGPITINLTVTGNQDGTGTFQVNRTWTLNNGVFTGSNPQTFTVNARAPQDPATTFTTSGTISVGAGQASGTFTLHAGAFNFTASNQQGGKLAAGTSSSYAVTVASANTAPHVSVAGVSDGVSYEFGSVPTASCTVTDAEDASPAATPTLSAITGPLSTYGLGSRTATCSYTDGGGLTASASATYTIVDSTKPTLNTPGDQTLEATGPGGAEATWSGPTGGDNVALAAGSPSCDVSSPHTFSLGAHTVTCSAADVAGNTRSGSFTVTVTDTTGPSVIAPADATEEATSSSGAVVSYGAASASDLHDGPLTPTCVPASGSEFTVGNTTVTCSATDSSGNPGTATFTVHVVDTTPPTVNVPKDKTVEATGPSGATVSFSPTATDLVDGDTAVTCAPVSGSTFALGQTSVTCTSTDAHHNTGHASFKITVVDTTPPIVTVPADKSVEATGPSGATASFTATAIDLVDGDTAVTCNPASGALFALGETTVTCTSTDTHTNTGHSSFKVTVVDTTAPDVTVPGAKTAEATGASGATVAFSASAADIVDGDTAVTCDPASSSTFPLGETTVTCSSTDAHHNTGHASFTITVVDTTPPLVTVPADPTAEATGPGGAMVAFTVTAVDLVDGPTAVSCTPDSGSTFALGDTPVSCSSTDTHDNTGTGSFAVHVVDTTPPALTLPSAITRSATSAAGAVVSYTATAADLVDGAVTANCTPASGSTFAPGTTTVHCSATDAHGNTANGSFTVTVNFGWNGFFAPVDNNGVLNTIRGGQSVPMKWNIPNGSGGWISALDVVSSVRQSTFTCTAGAPTDDVEAPTSGQTSLRYDTTANQYIYNWQSPKTTNTCYRVTVTLTDGSARSALFKTK